MIEADPAAGCSRSIPVAAQAARPKNDDDGTAIRHDAFMTASPVGVPRAYRRGARAAPGRCRVQFGLYAGGLGPPVYAGRFPTNGHQRLARRICRQVLPRPRSRRCPAAARRKAPVRRHPASATPIPSGAAAARGVPGPVRRLPGRHAMPQPRRRPARPVRFRIAATAAQFATPPQRTAGMDVEGGQPLRQLIIERLRPEHAAAAVQHPDFAIQTADPSCRQPPAQPARD